MDGQYWTGTLKHKVECFYQTVQYGKMFYSEGSSGALTIS